MEVSLFLLVLVIVLYGALGMFQNFWQQRQRATTYQAVFLTNGQVYFGKLQGNGRNEVLLQDVYYLQSAGTVQPASSQTTSANANVNTSPANTNTPQYSLVKLGQELHGPTDRMYINRSQVLFTEDLRSNSQVVQAILNTGKK